MKKTPITRKIASAIFAIAFIAELLLFSPILSSYPITQLSAGHLITILMVGFLPAAALFVVYNRFTQGKIKALFTYAMIFYLATNIALYSSSATFYAAGLKAADVNVGYIALGAKAAAILIAILLSIYEPKEVVETDEEIDEETEDEEFNADFFNDDIKTKSEDKKIEKLAAKEEKLAAKEEKKEVKLAAKEEKVAVKEDKTEVKADKKEVKAEVKTEVKKEVKAEVKADKKEDETKADKVKSDKIKADKVKADKVKADLEKAKADAEKEKKEAAVKSKAKEDAVKDIVAEIIADKKSDELKKKMYDYEAK